MKILVSVKRVVDYNVKVRVKSDGTGVDIANVKRSRLGARHPRSYGLEADLFTVVPEPSALL